MPKKKEKVFVAMSGGVDSSVASALLKRDGLAVPGHPEQRRRVDVVGVYMKCWTANDPLYSGCTSLDDERSARLAASHLDIPFYTWNFIKEYRERVVEYLIGGYKKGITPNPDIMCNKEIKFGLFFEKAMKLGADFVATGHYARVEAKNSFQKTDGPFENGHLRSRPAYRRASEGFSVKSFRLLAGKDKNKDQSYFLSFIKPKVLSKVLFPVGNYTKQEVRALAKKFGLPNAERKESQGICFIGKLNFADFLRQHIPCEPGIIVDTKGTVLGKHQGLPLYTIGQRKDIRLSGGPWYVVEKNYKTNTLIVSKDEKELGKKEAKVTNMNWFSDVLPEDSQKVDVKIRYRTSSVPATLSQLSSTSYKLVFSDSQRAVTPGQFAVLYNGEELLGGGVIA